jgi:hypothetical protein
MVDSMETKVARLEDKVNRIEGILDGRPGEKGLKQSFTDFYAAYEQREKDKMRYDDRQSAKQNLIIALGMLILTALIAFFTWLGVHHDKQAMLQSANPTVVAEYSSAR